jgi:hypothetical protein
MVPHPGEGDPTHYLSQWPGPRRGERRIAAATGRGLRGPPACAARRQRHGGLAPRRVVPAGAEVQVHPAALPLDLIDLALAVVLATRLERQQLGVPRKRLECCQQVFTVMRPG